MKKFKFYSMLFCSVIAISLVGILLAIFTQHLTEKYPLYCLNAIWLNILILITTVLISILIHEIIHLLTFVIGGFSIRLFTVCGLYFANNRIKKRFGLKFNASIGIGGLVLPVVPNINNYLELKKIAKRYALSLLAAPVFSAVFGFICMFMALCVTPYVYSNFQSSFFAFCWFSFFVNIYINILSLFNIGGALGDYKAYKMYMTDEAFAAFQFYSDIELSHYEGFKTNETLNEIILEDLSKSYDSKIISTKVFEQINLFLYQYLLNKVRLNPTVINYINYILDLIKDQKSMIYHESEVILLVHLVEYIYESDAEKAIKLWDSIKSKIIKNELYTYYKNQVDNLLYGNADHIKSIRKSSLDSVLEILDNYYSSEEKINDDIQKGFSRTY